MIIIIIDGLMLLSAKPHLHNNQSVANFVLNKCFEQIGPSSHKAVKRNLHSIYVTGAHTH